MNYSDYLHNRIVDLKILRGYLPEFNAEFDMAINGTKAAIKFEPLAKEINQKISYLLGHELTWPETDLFTNIFMAKATAMASEEIQIADYSEITSDDYLDKVVDSIVDNFRKLLGIESSTEVIRESIKNIVKQMLAME